MAWYDPVSWFAGSKTAGSVVDSVWDYFTEGEFVEDVTGVWNTATSFLDNPLVQKVGGYLSGATSSKPTMSSASAPKADTSATTSAFSPSASSLGFTDRVMSAGRTAYTKAPAGSSIQATFDAIAARRSQGPLLRISQSGIDASNRKRKKRA